MQSSSLVWHRASNNPRPFVVLLPWALAKPSQVKRFTALYDTLGWDTLVFYPRVISLWLPQLAAQQATTVIKEVLQEFSRTCPRPFVFACFSGAPKLCYGKLLQAVHEKPTRTFSALELSTFRRFAVGQMFDSSPVDFTSDSGVKLLVGAAPAYLAALAEFGGNFAAGCMDFVLLEWFEQDRQRMWHVLEHCALPGPSLFLYSRSDDMTNCEAVHRLVLALRSRGKEVVEQVWQDSHHLAHLKTHPQQYMEAVQHFFALAGREATRRDLPNSPWDNSTAPPAEVIAGDCHARGAAGGGVSAGVPGGMSGSTPARADPAAAVGHLGSSANGCPAVARSEDMAGATAGTRSDSSELSELCSTLSPHTSQHPGTLRGSPGQRRRNAPTALPPLPLQQPGDASILHHLREEGGGVGDRMGYKSPGGSGGEVALAASAGDAAAGRSHSTRHPRRLSGRHGTESTSSTATPRCPQGSHSYTHPRATGCGDGGGVCSSGSGSELSWDSFSVSVEAAGAAGRCTAGSRCPAGSREGRLPTGSITAAACSGSDRQVTQRIALQPHVCTTHNQLSDSPSSTSSPSPSQTAAAAVESAVDYTQLHQLLLQAGRLRCEDVAASASAKPTPPPQPSSFLSRWLWWPQFGGSGSGRGDSSGERQNDGGRDGVGARGRGRGRQESVPGLYEALSVETPQRPPLLVRSDGGLPARERGAGGGQQQQQQEPLRGRPLVLPRSKL